MIHTKLVVEVEPAKFLSLGFGSIANSEADVVCVSAYPESEFVPNSAIGAIGRALEEREVSLSMLLRSQPGWQEGRATDGSTLLDLTPYGTLFRRLLIIWMGNYGAFIASGSTETAIQVGLQSALSRLRKLEPSQSSQMDITALGSQYGGLQRKRAFDLVASWAAQLFKTCPSLNHLRLVAYDLDTFVDFYEALHRLRSWTGRELVFGEAIHFDRYGTFSNDVVTAIDILDRNPRQVLVICRTIVETVVCRLCENNLGQQPRGLFEDIKELHTRGFLPENINSFFHTCRVLGNFANHGNAFQASRRDAEGVMLLTLRIVEWFLGSGGTISK